MQFLHGLKLTSIAAMAILAATSAHANCDWNIPGSNPTTSKPAATLAAMGIDDPELAHKIEAGEYDELVTMHRNDHRAYGMSSGNARWCNGEIDTTKWRDDQEEQGRVYRLHGHSVVWYWRCKNMSIWLPESMPVALPPIISETALEVPAGPIAPIFGNAAADEVEQPPSAFDGYGMPGYAPGSFGAAGGGFVVLPCPCCSVGKPIAAVPEPPTFLFITLGFLLLVFKRFKLK